MTATSSTALDYRTLYYKHELGTLRSGRGAFAHYMAYLELVS